MFIQIHIAGSQNEILNFDLKLVLRRRSKKNLHGKVEHRLEGYILEKIIGTLSHGAVRL